MSLKQRHSTVCATGCNMSRPRAVRSASCVPRRRATCCLQSRRCAEVAGIWRDCLSTCSRSSRSSPFASEDPAARRRQCGEVGEKHQQVQRCSLRAPALRLPVVCQDVRLTYAWNRLLVAGSRPETCTRQPLPHPGGRKTPACGRGNGRPHRPSSQPRRCAPSSGNLRPVCPRAAT